MSSLTLILKDLEDKLEDLQRDTKFCVNNYDYHHKNNEHEIMQNLKAILKDSLNEGQQFLSNMENMRSSIVKARKKCSEIDELLLEMGVKSENSDTVDGCPTGSRSFHEEQEADLEKNKENSF